MDDRDPGARNQTAGDNVEAGMRMIRRRLAAALLASVALTACGAQTRAAAGPPASPPTTTGQPPTTTGHCSATPGSAFQLSLASDRGGQATPVLASEWFARHGGVAGIPQSGWQLDGSNGQGLFTRSGRVRLHVVQGPDKTWQVDSGTKCG